MNPNRIFKNREHFAKNYDPINEAQISSIIVHLKKYNIKWSDLCVAAIGFDKDLDKLTFLEASRCIITSGICDNLRGKDDQKKG